LPFERLEPYDGKLSRTVLRGLGAGNSPRLPGAKLEIYRMETFISQLLALVAFFAFPAFQYFFLRYITRFEGSPELWYLPAYGFRLVIRNLPRKKKLYDIKYQAFLRDIVRGGPGSSVNTLNDIQLLEKTDFFLFPGTDQVLIQFMLERDEKGIPYFIHTDKLGNEIKRVLFNEFELLISDYVATIQNLFHFDIKIQKRVKINRDDLIRMMVTIEHEKVEQAFPVSEVLDLG
jgi:hypothetical protein